MFGYLCNVLFDYFAKDVAKMNTKKFKEYLEVELGYDEELIESYFEDVGKKWNILKKENLVCLTICAIFFMTFTKETD